MMSILKKIAAYGVAVAGVTGFYLVLMISAAIPALLQPDNDELVKTGAALYQKHCASCHGVKLQGQPNWQSRLPNGRLPAPPHDKTGHTWHHNDALLFRVTKRGTKALVGGDYETDMRGFGGELTDHQIIAVLSYIKSTWPQNIKKRHDAMNGRK